MPQVLQKSDAENFTPVFDSIQFYPAADSPPCNSLCRIDNVLYFGAFFQFTDCDRYAWNRLVEFHEEPDPSELLGAKWCRITGHLSDEAFQNHMPRATKFAKDYCSKEPQGLPYHSNEPPPFKAS
mgnify:CR=1 FL=1